MYNNTLAKQQRRKQMRRRRMIVNGLCVALIGTAVWFVSYSVAVPNKVREAEHQLQVVSEEKEALQREVNRLEIVVSKGAFFQEDTEWVAEHVLTMTSS